MASTSVTRIGKLMVVTQVIASNEGSIQLQNPPPVTQAPVSAPVPVPVPVPVPTPAVTPAKTDQMKPHILQGEPQCLGVIQIFIGVLCMTYSTMAVFSVFLYAPFCLAFTFVVSGALTLAAHRKNNIVLVGYVLVWNVLSVLVGVAGVAFICWQLVNGPSDVLPCMPWYSRSNNCYSQRHLNNAVVVGLPGLLMVLLVLQVCVATTTTVFSCKAIVRHRSSAYLEVGSCDRSPLLPDGDDQEIPRAAPEVA